MTWQESLNSQLLHRLFRPLQPGVLDGKIGRDILARTERMTSRLPLLITLAERQVGIVGDTMPMVYAQAAIASDPQLPNDPALPAQPPTVIQAKLMPEAETVMNRTIAVPVNAPVNGEQFPFREALPRGFSGSPSMPIVDSGGERPIVMGTALSGLLNRFKELPSRPPYGKQATSPAPSPMLGEGEPSQNIVLPLQSPSSALGEGLATAAFKKRVRAKPWTPPLTAQSTQNNIIINHPITNNILNHTSNITPRSIVQAKSTQTPRSQTLINSSQTLINSLPTASANQPSSTTPHNPKITVPITAEMRSPQHRSPPNPFVFPTQPPILQSTSTEQSSERHLELSTEQRITSMNPNPIAFPITDHSPLPPPIDLEALTTKIERKLVKRLAVERQRRGQSWR
jgi:hypothetical protein